MPEWRNSFAFNQRDFATSQLNLTQAWEELDNKLEVSDRQQAQKQID